MKKVLFVVFLPLAFLFVAKAQDSNPIVKRLSPTEISQCLTPSAVAYNFIESILSRDLDRMLSYTDPYFTMSIAEEIRDNNLTEDQFFTMFFSEQEGEKLNILGWIPALDHGYEVAIAYVQDLWYYEKGDSRFFSFEQVVKDGMIYLPGETTPHVGILVKKVYVTCSPTSEIDNVGFQNITRYGRSNVKILMEQIDGVWKVTGFK